MIRKHRGHLRKMRRVKLHLNMFRSAIRELKKMRSGLDAAIAGLEQALDGFGRQQ